MARVREREDGDRRQCLNDVRSLRSQLLERRFYVANGLEPPLRLLRETPHDDGGRGRVQGTRLFAHHGVQRVEERLALENSLARQQLVQHGAEAEDIRPHVRGFALRLLRRHVRRRPKHRAGDRPRRIIGAFRQDLREPEVEQLRAARRHHDVGRLQIAVQDALRVRGVQRVGHLRGDLQHLTQRHRTVQRRPVDVFHDEIPGPDVVEHADVRVVQRGDGASLLLEALAVRAIECFDRDRAAETGVGRLVDLAHAAGADGRDDLVRTKPVTWRKGHSGERRSYDVLGPRRSSAAIAQACSRRGVIDCSRR